LIWYPVLDCSLQQVAVEEVQRASGTSSNQQELPPSMSSFCLSVVQNTLMHSPKTPSDTQHDTDAISSSHCEDQQERVVALDSSSSNQEDVLDTLCHSRDLSPCLDTSPVHTGAAMFEPDMVLRVDDEDEVTDATAMLEMKNEESGRIETAAAGVASWSVTQWIGAAAWAAPMSDFNANESSCIVASAMSQAECLPSISSTNLNSIPTVAVHVPSMIVEDPSLPSQSSPKVFALSAAAAVSLEHERVNENTTRVGDVDEDAPVLIGALPLTIQKLQLDKVRQESQVNS
jgi:hypothetical protein